MAVIFSKTNKANNQIEVQLVDSCNSFGPHIELRSQKQLVALSLSDEEIEAVRQWCVRVQTWRKEVDDVLNETCGVDGAL